MRAILSGIETEYGLYVEGRGAADQIDDARELVRACPGEFFVGWDYRHESPRRDLRGFVLERLAVDPVDAAFDVGRRPTPDQDLRADRVLPNGARFYNDHGHPEYSTPECLSSRELALADKVGERVVLEAARRFAAAEDRVVRVYKNNTDRHGASYGTHENFLVPRDLGFQRLFDALLPMLLVRPVLCGAGKVGAESGAACAYQLSQRADFFVETVNAETLFRRPIFNTRDEPHARPEDWIRLHVICGDANLVPSATHRKIDLVRIALALAEIGEAPVWKPRDPVLAAKAISRDETHRFAFDLEGGSWTNAHEVFESYFAAAERFLDLENGPGPELGRTIAESRRLLDVLSSDFDAFAYSVDWAAKLRMVREYLDAEGTGWNDPALGAFDLEYHNLDPDEGLGRALQQMGRLEPDPPEDLLDSRRADHPEPTRARARGLAVRNFGPSLRAACWRTLVFETADELLEVELPPTRPYPPDLAAICDVESFVGALTQ
ncbi:MAG: proteasome accessory factor PafA2 family protein [Fimbriimonadaceae bacterium]|nr:proteasome accessory factor PafA2 family protein [Fimbriimonadaceae bacterium]